MRAARSAAASARWAFEISRIAGIAVAPAAVAVWCTPWNSQTEVRSSASVAAVSPARRRPRVSRVMLLGTAPAGAALPDVVPAGAVLPDVAPAGAVFPDAVPAGARGPDAAGRGEAAGGRGGGTGPAGPAGPAAGAGLTGPPA